MSRSDVISWIDLNGRMTKYHFIKSNDELWNKIEIKNIPETFIFSHPDDICGDHYVMNLDVWLIGGQSYKNGSRLYYRLVFKNNKVIEQSDKIITP